MRMLFCPWLQQRVSVMVPFVMFPLYRLAPCCFASLTWFLCTYLFSGGTTAGSDRANKKQKLTTTTTPLHPQPPPPKKKNNKT